MSEVKRDCSQNYSIIDQLQKEVNYLRETVNLLQQNCDLLKQQNFFLLSHFKLSEEDKLTYNQLEEPQ